METWWQILWRTLIEMEPTTFASIINAVAIVVLVIITWRYVHYTKQLVKETRLARRDDPELKAYLREPSQQDLIRRQITAPSGTFLTFTLLQINPGAVPIVIENVTENVSKEESNGKVTAHAEGFQFALPKEIRPEQLSLYAFGLPWVITSDSFTVWSRYLSLNNNTDGKYVLNVQVDYTVSEKPKSKTVDPLSLTPMHGSGYRTIAF